MRKKRDAHADRIMVRVGKAGGHDLAVRHFAIRRNQKAVDRQHQLPVVIRTVRVADRGDRAVFSLRRNEPDIGFLQQIKAKRLRPGIVLGGNAEICFAAVLQQGDGQAALLNGLFDFLY